MLQASSFLRDLHELAGSRLDLNADDLLLFLYRVRDECGVRRTSTNGSKKTSFGFLPGVLYQLESRPEATLQSEEWRSRIEALLRDLAEGNIALLKKE